MPLTTKEMYEFGPFSLDPAERLISRDGVPLSLTPKVFDTLVCLVRKRGRLLTKDELLKELWPDTFVDEVNLAVNISTLRKALGENAHDARYIATVPGHGYRFVAEVREIPQRSNGEFVPTGRSERFERALREHSRGGILAASTSPESNNAGAVPWSFFTSRGVIQRGAILVLVLMLALLVVGLYLQSREKRRIGTAMAPTSIAVLPFADLSAGKDQEYFSDGLAEELINYLAKVPSVRVVARSSSFQFNSRGRTRICARSGGSLG